jgi:hypothetical protein
MCFVFPGLVCTLWGDNFWNGYWVAGGLRWGMKYDVYNIINIFCVYHIDDYN